MKDRIKRKLINLCIAFLVCTSLVIALDGCSRNTSEENNAGEENSVTEQPGDNQDEEALSWNYDGGETVIPGEKSEIVTASADATGEVYKISSSVTISGFEDNGDKLLTVKDASNLINIRNRNGAEEFDYRENEGVIYWENQGASIEYEGEGKEDLPVELKITYWLNDREVTPNEIIGKSGHIKIRFDYINKTPRTIVIDEIEYGVPVPFGVITAIFLPEGTIKNFEGENVRLSKMSSQDVVMGVAFPGISDALNMEEKDFGEDIELPSYIEFEGDTEDFKIDFSTTIIQNGIFTDEETEDRGEDKKDQIQELIDSMRDLKSATNSLVNGADSLLSGEKQLRNGIEQYLNGVSSISSGATSLYNGISALDSNGQSMVDGANSLRDGAAQISSAIGSYANNLEAQLSVSTDNAQPGGSASIDAIPDVNINITIPEDLPEEQKQELEEVKAALEAQTAQLSAVKQGLKGAAEQIEAGQRALIQAQSQVRNTLLPMINELDSQLTTLSEGAGQLASGIQAYTNGVSQLESGAKELKDGAEQLTSQNQTIKNGMSSLENGITSFRNGLVEYRDEGINELVSFVEDDLSDLSNRIKALKEADKSYSTFSGIDKNTKGTVTYIIETDGVS